MPKLCLVIWIIFCYKYLSHKFGVGMLLRKLFLMSALWACSAFGASDSSDGFMISGLDHPESVAFDGENYYISNVGKDLNPTAKDGDGYITKVSPDGTVLEAKWIDGLNAPKGMIFAFDRLWVTDIDQVYGYDVKTKTADPVFSFVNRRVQFNQQQVQFLNDIVASNDGYLFVSGTDTGLIYRIALEDGRRQSFPVDVVRGPNGLFINDKTMYAVGFGDSNQANGPVVAIQARGTDNAYDIKQISPLLGNLDGVAVYNNNLLVSDWKTGSLYQIPIDGKGKQVAIMQNLSGPADFMISNDNIWLPEMTAGRVIVKKMQ